MSAAEEVSSTIEEYLETIYRLEEKGGSARTSDIAKELNVTLGTITNTVESLERQNLVAHKPYRGVRLTRKGRRIALDIVRRHRLSERLLTDVLRLDWSKAHDAACKLEHAITDTDVVKQLEEALGKPKTCPHGNPIPTESGMIFEEESKLLVDLRLGEEGTIVKITDERPDLLRHLQSLGFVPGATLKIEEKTPLDGSLMVSVGDVSHALGETVASLIWVRKTSR